jgi:hypothetical protein
VLDMFVEISWQKVGSIDGILWTRLWNCACQEAAIFKLIWANLEFLQSSSSCKVNSLFRWSVSQHKMKLWRPQSVPFLQPPLLQRCTSLCLFVLPQT